MLYIYTSMHNIVNLVSPKVQAYYVDSNDKVSKILYALIFSGSILLCYCIPLNTYIGQAFLIIHNIKYINVGIYIYIHHTIHLLKYLELNDFF